MGRGVWGIDVSKYSVKAVRLENTKGTPELTALDVIQYASAGTGDTGALDDQIREALADLKANNKIGSERVVLSLPGHSTFNRLVKLPPVDDSKIPEIVRYEAQSQIPFNIDEVIWDYQLIERQYGPGEEKEVILFAIKRDIVEQFLENIKEVALNIDAIQFGPVALYNFLLADQNVGNSCVALDMGSDNTDLVIVDGSKFWVRNLPITGNDITRALQKAFNIPFHEAEKLKIKAGQSQQAQKIFNAIQPVLRDLVGEIHRSIGYYKSISKQIRFDRILLMGNATRTLNFQKFISQSLQMPAARVQKLNRCLVGSVDAGLLNNALPSLGTALGLALQGLGEGNNKVNLLPPVYLKKKELKKKQPMVIAAAAVLFGLVGFMYVGANGELDELTKIENEAERVSMTYNARVAEFAGAQKIAPHRVKLEPLTTIASERDLILRVLDEVNRNLPDNADRKVKDEDKIWVLEWTFEEREIIETIVKRGRFGKRKARLIPAKRALHVTLEIAIKKRDSAEKVKDFVAQKLLNINPITGKRVDPDSKKRCIVETFHLEEGKLSGSERGWAIQAAQDIPGPVPKRVLEGPMPPEEFSDEVTNEFTRVIVTLYIPMGEENRKPKEAPKAKEGK